MLAPQVRFETIEAHIGADPAFTKEFGQRVKDCGGKYSEIRGGTSVRYVTIPTSEGALLDQIVSGTISSKVALVLRDFVIDGAPAGRTEAVVRKAMGSPTCYWTRKKGRPSVFAAEFVESRMQALPWEKILADWADDDAREEERRRAAWVRTQISDLKDQIAYEAARIAEGANDWDTIRELGARYSELCAEAGIDLSVAPSAEARRA